MAFKHLNKIVNVFLTGLVFVSYTQYSFSQVTGGQRAFQFLQVANSPHITAMGTLAPASIDNDVSLMLQNPALLNTEMQKQLYASYNIYYAGIGIMNLGYTHYHERSKTMLGASIQYFNYGKFTHTDIYGNILGDVRANDMSFNVSAGRYYKNNWHYGATAKIAYSALADRSALALLTDIGVAYQKPEQLLSVGIVAKNIGVMAKKYNPENKAEPLPFDLQIGVMKGLKNMPLRVFMVAHHLYEWDIRYQDPVEMLKTDLQGNPIVDTSKSFFVDKLFRHFNFGGELTLAKRVTASVAYSHLRRREMGYDKRMGLAGFSFGLGIDLNKIKMQYGRAYYGSAGAYNEIGFIFDMARLLPGNNTQPAPTIEPTPLPENPQ